jgi:hypothetical protein
MQGLELYQQDTEPPTKGLWHKHHLPEQEKKQRTGEVQNAGGMPTIPPVT